MASLQATQTSARHPHLSESTPLLPTPKPATRTSTSVRQRVVALLCLFTFLMSLGDSLQVAALFQVYEDIICREHYEAEGLKSAPFDCKDNAIQKELAFVRGLQQLVPVFAAVFCTIPYGLLAQRVGRKPILILSGAGLFLQLAWALVIAQWQFLPLRWVWLSGLFLFIGGGDAVSATVAHIMVTDAVDVAGRAQVFLYLHAADVAAGLVGPAISAPLMGSGNSWTVLLLALVGIFVASFLLPCFIPETLSLQETHATAAGTTTTSPTSGTTFSREQQLRTSSMRARKQPTTFVDDIRSSIMPLFEVLCNNRQALLLLCIFAPQTAARELFNVLGLQYAGAKFSLPYSQGNFLLSLFNGAQGLLVLVLLPTLTRLLAEPRGWSAWSRDRIYAIMSMGITAVGLQLIAAAPAIWFMVIGLLIVAMGGCTSGLVMSLLGAAVQKDQIAAVYSVAPMLSLAMRSLTGPMASLLLIEGLELGWAWIGLPFAVAGLVILCTLGLSMWLSAQNHDDAQRIDSDED